jgi:hypothetical protein
MGGGMCSPTIELQALHYSLQGPAWPAGGHLGVQQAFGEGKT